MPVFNTGRMESQLPASDAALPETPLLSLVLGIQCVTVYVRYMSDPLLEKGSDHRWRELNAWCRGDKRDSKLKNCPDLIIWPSSNLWQSWHVGKSRSVLRSEFLMLVL